MATMNEGLDGWLQRVRKTEEFSDVVVRVNGEEFRLHMLPLRNASAFFRNLPSSSNGDEQASKLVTIHDLPGGVEGFTLAVDMCYLLKPGLTERNVTLVLAAAEFLAMEEVTEGAKRFMSSNIFSHWRHCSSLLRSYARLGSPVDEYVESRSLAVVATACVKSFTEIKHLSAPSSFISGPHSAIPPKQSSACRTLTELLVRVCSLPDVYVAQIVDTLVSTDVNLNLKCRQGRNVRSWLENLVDDECQSDRARCWVLLCLSRMLLKNVPAKHPRMELSSQYWCRLLEHADQLLPLLDDPLKAMLAEVKAMLEATIGESLDEMDEYLRDYKFGPETLLALVENYASAARQSQGLSEIANDVDQFLWFYAEECSISVDTFVGLVGAFPASARASHDTVYGAVEKLLAHMPGCAAADRQQLRSLVDRSKLSASVRSAAARQPAELECDLHRHSRELARGEETDGRHLRHVMQQVIDASLKLLEENSQRTREIVALQKQYGELLDGRAKRLDHEFGIVEEFLRRRETSSARARRLSRGSLSSDAADSEISDNTSLATISSSITDLECNCSKRRMSDIFTEEPADCSNGEINLCYDKCTKQSYACKTISKDGRIDQTRKQLQMDDEATILQHLMKTIPPSQKSIIKLEKVFEDKEATHLILEHCRGGSLIKRVMQYGSFSETDIAKIMYQIMSAIQACHKVGVMHRDVKPDNILLCGDHVNSLNVKLIDYGYSTFFRSPQHKFKHIVGSERYMAPEMKINGKYGIEVDVWAAGITLYVLFFEEFPYFTFDQLYIPERTNRNNKSSPISPYAKEVLCHMLTFDPKKRMTTQEFFRHPWISKVNKQHLKEYHTSSFLQELQDGWSNFWSDVSSCFK